MHIMYQIFGQKVAPKNHCTLLVSKGHLVVAFGTKWGTSDPPWSTRMLCATGVRIGNMQRSACGGYQARKVICACSVNSHFRMTVVYIYFQDHEVADVGRTLLVYATDQLLCDTPGLTNFIT